MVDAVMDSLAKTLPMLVALILSQLLYLKIDAKFNLTGKIALKLPIRAEWKASFIICAVILSILLVGVIGIYVIDIPDLLYAVICGIFAGVSICIAIKLPHKDKNQ